MCLPFLHVMQLTTKKKVNKYIIKLSEYQTYGARKIEKIIENNIESLIIDSLEKNKHKLTIDSILITE